MDPQQLLDAAAADVGVLCQILTAISTSDQPASEISVVVSSPRYATPEEVNQATEVAVRNCHKTDRRLCVTADGPTLRFLAERAADGTGLLAVGWPPTDGRGIHIWVDLQQDGISIPKPLRRTWHHMLQEHPHPRLLSDQLLRARPQ